MRECTKAARRRMADPDFVARYFVGVGLDIGPGNDPLSLHQAYFPQIIRVDPFDQVHGDAQGLQPLADESYDFVHSSHCLEHLVDCRQGLNHWFRVLKPGGHLILTVPDEDLYEQGVFPSTFNTDHKWTFTLNKARSWSDRSINMIDLVLSLGPTAEIKRLSLVEFGFTYGAPRFDQTMTPLAECSIEIILRKRPVGEIDQGGRLPEPGLLAPATYALLTGQTPPQALATRVVNQLTKVPAKTASLWARFTKLFR